MSDMILTWENGVQVVRAATPADQLPAPAPPDPAAIQAAYTAAVEAHVDATARERNYRDATSCASYVASTNTAWAAEAEAFVAWRDAVWSEVLAVYAAVLGGADLPALPDLIADLPAMVWPE